MYVIVSGVTEYRIRSDMCAETVLDSQNLSMVAVSESERSKTHLLVILALFDLVPAYDHLRGVVRYRIAGYQCYRCQYLFILIALHIIQDSYLRTGSLGNPEGYLSRNDGWRARAGGKTGVEDFLRGLLCMASSMYECPQMTDKSLHKKVRYSGQCN